MNANQWSARWTGTITAPASGEYTFALTSDDGSRLLLGGRLLIDNWRDQAPVTETAKVTLTAGQAVPLEVDFYQNAGGDSIGFGWLVPGQPSLLDEAVALARSSDVAVVFASDFETEGADLSDIDLSGEQNALIRAVAAANPKTIVVLNTGSAVTMPWIDSVKAVLEAWYPGQEDGNAIAAVLFGDVNPSGKLPVSFPRSLADVPAASAARWPGEGGQVRYAEGLEVGYRWYQGRKIAPLFPFGFGLSYSTFRFANLRVARGRGRRVAVAADVTNAGRRAGSDVVQVYVGFPAADGEPPLAAKGVPEGLRGAGRDPARDVHARRARLRALGQRGQRLGGERGRLPDRRRRFVSRSAAHCRRHARAGWGGLKRGGAAPAPARLVRRPGGGDGPAPPHSGNASGASPAVLRARLNAARPVVLRRIQRAITAADSVRARSQPATSAAVGATSAPCIAIAAARSASLAPASVGGPAGPRRKKRRARGLGAGASDSTCAPEGVPLAAPLRERIQRRHQRARLEVRGVRGRGRVVRLPRQ